MHELIYNYLVNITEMIPFQNTVIWLAILAAVYVLQAVYRSVRGAGRPRRRGDLPAAVSLGSRWTLYFMAVVFVSVVLRASTVNIISITSDEGFFIYSAKRVYEGLQPYRGFILTQQPLYMYVTTAVFRLLGVGVVQAKLIPVAASVLTVLLAYRFAERVWGRDHALASAAVIGFSPYVVKYTNAATAYPEVILLDLAASVLFLQGLRGGGYMRLFLSGVCAGLAALYKMLGAVVIAPMLLFLIFRHRRGMLIQSSVILGGALIALIPATALLWSPEYVYQVYLHHGLYEDSGVGCKVAEFFKVLAVDPVFMVPGLVGAFLAYRKVKRKPEEEYFLMYLACTLPLLFILKYLCGFAHPYLYFTMSIPPLAVLSGAAFTKAREGALPVLVSLLLSAAVGYYIYFVSESYNNALINSVAEYVGENSKPGEQVMGMSYLACPVALKAGRDIPPEFMEFFHLRVEVENYTVGYYMNATGDVKYAVMYDTRQYPEFNRFLSQHAALEKTYGRLKPLRLYRIIHE